MLLRHIAYMPHVRDYVEHKAFWMILMQMIVFCNKIINHVDFMHSLIIIALMSYDFDKKNYSSFTRN